MTSRNLTLRRARARDLPALNRLMRAASAYRGAYAAILEGYAVSDAHLAQRHVVLAEERSEVMGFYSLIVRDQPELDLMFVADVAQGLGLGQRLFGDMAEAARRLGIAEVLITSHPLAVGFYERMGATRVGIAPPKGRVTWERPILRLLIA